jgi:hypothetical protein
MNHLRVLSVSLLIVLSHPGFFASAADASCNDRASSPRVNMCVARVAHEMVQLDDSSILVVGGAWSELGGTRELEVFVPATGRFAKTKAQLLEPRAGATVTRLGNKTLVAGGATDFETALNSAEVIVGAGQSVARVGDMTVSRSGHTATLLPNGKVLIIGGTSGDSVLRSAEVFDPATDSFSPLRAKMSIPRSGHSATMISDRLILVTGGESGDSADSSRLGTHDWAPVDSAEIFDIAKMTFVPVSNPMSAPRIYHQATLMDGNVLVSGGIKGVGDGNDSADLFITDRLAFEPLPPMLHKRSLHTATRLNNGNALLCGGVEDGEGSASCEIFDAVKKQFRGAARMKAARWHHAALALPNGKVLISGGIANDVNSGNADWAPTTSAELYGRRD